MAINMDSFHTAFNKLDANLRDELFEIINGDAKKIISNITELIRDNFNIREDYIEEFVQEHFIQPMEYSQNTLADLIADKADIVTKVISRDAENGRTNPESRLAVLMNEIPREFNGANLEGIKNDFISALKGFLYRFGVNDFFGTDLDENNADEVRYEVSKYLSRLVDGYINNTKDAIQKHTTEYRESLDFGNKNELTTDDIKNRIFVGMMSNYRIKSVDNGFAFIDSTTNEVIPATKSGNNTIKSLDGNLEFTYGDKIWTLREGQRVTTLSDAFVALGTKDDPNHMSVEFGFDTATFKYRGQKIEDPVVINDICEEFRKKSPQIYERDFVNNSAVAEIVQKASQVAKDTEKFITDESGKVHINPTAKSSLDTYLEAIGYYASEREDGIYVTNADGVEQKATISGSSMFLPDKTTITVDLYISTGQNKLTGPEIRYNNPNKNESVFVSQDFSKITVFIGKDLYATRINYGVLETRATIGETKISDADTIISTISSVVPNAMAKLQAQVKQKAANNYEDMFKTDKAPEKAVSDNAAMFKTGNVPEKPAMDNASRFITDEDVSKVLQEELDEKANQEIKSSNEAAFNSDLPDLVGFGDELANLAAEIDETPDYAVTQEEQSINNESEVSLSEIDDRLFELAQDPKVQEYLNLMKKAEELRNAQSLPAGLIL